MSFPNSKLRTLRSISLGLFLFHTACGGIDPSPPSHLPPSASDLDVLGSIKLCETKTTSQLRWKDLPIEKTAWGSGEEFFLKGTSSRDKQQWLFFSDDDILVGAVVKYPEGIDLEPYPVLRQTLSQLPPTREFYLNASSLLSGAQPDSVQLYRTGDEKTTTEYFVRQRVDDEYRDLLVAVIVIDPFENLLEGSQDKFLSSSNQKTPQSADPQNQPQKDQTFLATQQFARGEVALFKSCKELNNPIDVAIDAYSSAIQIGIEKPNRLAEAHHRLGLSLRNKGKFVEAQQELEKSLKIRPLAPRVLNSLGSVLLQLDKPAQAVNSLERAIVLQPNYARARYNLAQAYEKVNPKRAREEYETYLVLVDGIPEESTRAALAQDRLRQLK